MSHHPRITDVEVPHTHPLTTPTHGLCWRCLCGAVVAMGLVVVPWALVLGLYALAVALWP